MADFPQEVYDRIASKLHPVPLTSPPVTTTTVGNIKLTLLAEAVYDIDIDFPFVPSDHGSLRGYLNADGRLPGMQFGCCLVEIGDDTKVLLDAAIGPMIGDKASGHPVPEPPPYPLKNQLEKLGVAMDEIDFVVHSHCHGDHVGWVGHFPRAIHVLHEREWEFASYSGCPWRQSSVKRFAPLQDAGRLRLLKDDQAIIDQDRAPGLTAILCRGHTPGHIVVKIQSISGQAAYYIGDALHFPVQLSQPDLIPIFDCCAWKIRPFLPFGGERTEVTWLPAMRRDKANWKETTSTRARTNLLKQIAQEKALLVSPHFPSPGMGYIRQDTSADEDTPNEAFEIEWACP